MSGGWDLEEMGGTDGDVAGGAAGARSSPVEPHFYSLAKGKGGQQ